MFGHQLLQLDPLIMKHLQLAIDNLYTLVISANCTRNTYSVIRSDLYNINTSDNAPDFIGFASEYLSSCPEEDLQNYPLICDFEALIEHLQNNKGVYTFEARFEIAPSTFNWFEGKYFLLEDDESSDLVLLLLFQDINDKKMIEENLRDAYTATEIASKAKTDFLSRMSQDLRTPINLIVSMIDLARQDIQNTDSVTDCLIKMDISARYLFQVIDNAIDMSLIEAGKFNIDNREFNIVELLDELKKSFEFTATNKNIFFDILIHNNGLDKVIGDAFRVKQILKNLISNSFKYVPTGGTVTVELLLNKILYNRAFFSIIVENDGLPMAEEEISRLFLPFERGSTNAKVSIPFKGLGLGLSICKNTVELLGGSISASNKADKSGVKFEVEVAFQLAEDCIPTGIELLSDDAFLRFPERHILVAEDDEMSFEVIKALLENRDITVDWAINGLEAVAAFENSESDYYDLILMDIGLPVMSGLDAATAIRNSFRNDGTKIPIIALIGHSQQEDIMVALNSGMNDHIVKPIDVNRLFSTLKNFI